MFHLDWPEERAGRDFGRPAWSQAGSNLCLDFHGDPARAELTVFSDGNHHMALMESLDHFSSRNGGIPIFYATTPPGPIVRMLKNDGLQMGNLVISATPHVFISPPGILDSLVLEGFLSAHEPLVTNQGNVLLVRKGNPKGLGGVSGLARPGVGLFLSNPETEKASYTAYYETLKALGPEGFPEDKIARGEVVFGQRIHHREAPQAVAEGSADAAMLFYHLALRFIRIFPDLFDLVPLGGTMDKPEPRPGNVVGVTHMGLVGDGGRWGRELLDFLASPEAMEIYRRHGLLPAD
jgi:hypothetical protein